MVDRIDFGGAEKWHDYRLHYELERAPEDEADDQRGYPAPGSHVTDLAPGRMRSPNPKQHQSGAERFQDGGQDDDENREESKRPKSAQLRGKGIVRQLCNSRFDGNALRKIRDVVCHASFQNTPSLTKTE